LDLTTRTALLRQVPFFKELEEEPLRQLAARATLTTFPSGQILIREGESGAARLFALAEGHVGVYRAGRDGKENVMAYLAPPEVVGELSLFEEVPRSASVKALERTVALVLERNDFLDFLQQNPKAAIGICRILSGRIRQNNDVINALASQQAHEGEALSGSLTAAPMTGRSSAAGHDPAEDEALGLYLVSEGLLERAAMILAMNRALDAGTPLTQVLIRMKLIDPAALAAAEARFLRMKRVHGDAAGDLATRLVAAGFLSGPEADLIKSRGNDAALAAFREQFALSDEDILNVLEYGHERFRRFDPQEVTAELVTLLPHALVEEHRVFPLKREENRLSLGMVAPDDTYAQELVAVATGFEVEAWLLTSQNFAELAAEAEIVAKAGRGRGSRINVEVIRDLMGLVRRTSDEAPSEATLPLLDGILRAAIRSRASDIHIEPQEERTRVRFRVDGMLQDMITIPPETHPRVVGAIKAASEMDVANRLIPQDGKAVFDAPDGRYVIRVSTLPVTHGEKIVMRLHKETDVALGIRDLGPTEKQFALLEALSRAPYGLVLVTGPVGSGKTTTLYSILHSIDVLRTNVVTIEDPVEYELPGVNHIEVNPKSGLTYAAGLRAILRQDPDVIMLGEIRDRETAQIATRAACTGVLMLTTLHTNDAPSAVTALLHMGVEPFFIVNSLLGVVAQRLVRILCEKCSEPYVPDTRVVETLGLDPGREWTFRRPVGCVACGHTGYRGRKGIFEVMRVTPAMEDLILKGAPESEIRDLAIREGMMTLRHSAIVKVTEGKTSVDEVIRKTAEE
jgi:type IV pilus assembly protein PilB